METNLAARELLLGGGGTVTAAKERILEMQKNVSSQKNESFITGGGSRWGRGVQGMVINGCGG